VRAPFWEAKSLAQMTAVEWESLCDGCGKCCLHKLEDEDTGDVAYTRIACSLLDVDSCRCTDYPQRKQRVPGCICLSPAAVSDLHWLPATCAYRLISEGKTLPEWHHLVCGSRKAIHRAGMSVQGRVLSEDYVHPEEWEEQIVHWVDQRP
jgi:uncharacterized cysteine cluster protein YcgN (CxxCxxCC family)